jgi:hypothetical protein
VAYTGLHAADGSINIAIVSGAAYTGSISVDGAQNAIVAPGGSYVGSTHPCGAIYITNSPAPVGGIPNPIRAPDGSLNCSVSPYTNGGQHVTTVAGVFP